RRLSLLFCGALASQPEAEAAPVDRLHCLDENAITGLRLATSDKRKRRRNRGISEQDMRRHCALLGVACGRPLGVCSSQGSKQYHTGSWPPSNDSTSGGQHERNTLVPAG